MSSQVALYELKKMIVSMDNRCAAWHSVRSLRKSWNHALLTGRTASGQMKAESVVVPLVTVGDAFSNAARNKCNHASNNVTVLCMTKHRKLLYAYLLTKWQHCLAISSNVGLYDWLYAAHKDT